jgi:hypothetical protein
MSIISNFTAEPNRIEMFISFLQTTSKQFSKKQLEDDFSPQSGRKGTSVFTEVFKLTESLGLVKVENDLVILNKKKLHKSKVLRVIKEEIFQSEFIVKDDFAFALAWLLSQNSVESLGWSDNLINKVLNDLDDEFSDFELTNNSNWQHFIYWCIYLGFATKISIGDKTFVCPDPTKAIKNELEVIFKNNKEMKIMDFMDELSNILPVLEFGNIRKVISSSVREGLQIPDNVLSFSTSIALLRLELRNIIKLTYKSDANSLSIKKDGKNEIISHIIYIG